MSIKATCLLHSKAVRKPVAANFKDELEDDDEEEEGATDNITRVNRQLQVHAQKRFVKHIL